MIVIHPYFYLNHIVVILLVKLVVGQLLTNVKLGFNLKKKNLILLNIKLLNLIVLQNCL